MVGFKEHQKVVKIGSREGPLALDPINVGLSPSLLFTYAYRRFAQECSHYNMKMWLKTLSFQRMVNTDELSLSWMLRMQRVSKMNFTRVVMAF